MTWKPWWDIVTFYDEFLSMIYFNKMGLTDGIGSWEDILVRRGGLTIWFLDLSWLRISILSYYFKRKGGIMGERLLNLGGFSVLGQCLFLDNCFIWSNMCLMLIMRRFLEADRSGFLSCRSTYHKLTDSLSLEVWWAKPWWKI